jgi:CelD/BcsL family acetyltransferase involved in cellulose biosynthesis
MSQRRVSFPDVRVTKVPMSELAEIWSTGTAPWRWRNPFVTPAWLAAWWECFGRDRQPLLVRIDTGGRLAGMAPLMVQDGTARFVGSEDLCDHGDFLVAPDEWDLFFPSLLGYLEDAGIHRLSLPSVRPDSAAMRGLVPVAHSSGCRVTVQPAGVSLEMDLPGSWGTYLNSLESKQRHEVRRKLRRASESGDLTLRTVRDPADTSAAMDDFLRLFRRSRPDKQRFMTPGREAFFRALADGLVRAGMLNLTVLEIDHRPAASTLCVDLGRTTYLYNNGFDPAFRSVSVGIVSKLMTIRSSVESGRGVYDFLNGSERYKYQLGGKEVVLSRCVVEW